MVLLKVYMVLFSGVWLLRCFNGVNFKSYLVLIGVTSVPGEVYVSVMFLCSYFHHVFVRGLILFVANYL